MAYQLITDEKFTNIQKAQAGLTRLFQKAQKTRSFYRVLRNDEALGVLVPNRVWESLIEDLEAMSSMGYKRRIAESRRSKKRYSSKKIKKELGL